MTVKYAVNIVPLLTLGWWPRNPFRKGVGVAGMMFREAQSLIDMAFEIGYNGVQMLPIRGATGNESGVLLYKDAWNAVPNLWHALMQWDGASNMPSNWKDWLVSPPTTICDDICNALRHREIQRVDHRFGQVNSWVEVNPDIAGVSPTGIDHFCRCYDYKLVIDTHHLRRDSRAGKLSPFLDGSGDWRPAVDLLAPHVRAIHVNASDATSDDFDETRAVARYVRLAAEKAGVHKLIVVAEYKPLPTTLLFPSKCRSCATEMFRFTRDCVEVDC